MNLADFPLPSSFSRENQFNLALDFLTLALSKVFRSVLQVLFIGGTVPVCETVWSPS